MTARVVRDLNEAEFGDELCWIDEHGGAAQGRGLWRQGQRQVNRRGGSPIHGRPSGPPQTTKLRSMCRRPSGLFQTEVSKKPNKQIKSSTSGPEILRDRDITVRGFHPVRWMDDPSWRKSRPRLCEWCAEWSVTIGIPRNLMQLATANRLPVANRRDKCREDATSLAGDTNIPEVLKHPRCPHALFCVLDSPASLVLINCTAGYHQAPCVAAWLMAKLAAL